MSTVSQAVLSHVMLCWLITATLPVMRGDEIEWHIWHVITHIYTTLLLFIDKWALGTQKVDALDSRQYQVIKHLNKTWLKY